jgi:isopenicillin N synthase-like dioxygenase
MLTVTSLPVLTFLAPGKVRALEVLNRDGQWISAPPIEGMYVVNVGDQLQR